MKADKIYQVCQEVEWRWMEVERAAAGSVGYERNEWTRYSNKDNCHPPIYLFRVQARIRLIANPTMTPVRA